MIFLVLVGLLVLPGVMAGTFTLVVKTHADNNLSVHVLNENGYELDYFEMNSDSTGTATEEVSSSESRVDFSIISRKDGKIMVKGVYESYQTAGTVTIDMMEVEENETEEGNVTTNQTEELNETNNETLEEDLLEDADESPEENLVPEEPAPEESEETIDPEGSGGLTGAVVSEDDGFFSNTVYIIVASVFAALLVAALVLKLTLSRRGGLSKTFNYSLNNGMSNVDVDILKQQKKIREAEEEIEKIREKKKIMQEAQEKLKAAEEEIARLKKGAKPQEDQKPKSE